MTTDNSKQVLLRTVHGSFLYGINNAESDLDTYTVFAGHGRAKQKVVDGLDYTVVPLSAWLYQCEIGVPQALEAMFSPVADPGPLDAYRAAYVVNLDAMRDRYRRTIKNFIMDDRYPAESRQSFKRRRHALRLALNLEEASRYGRFNPRLSEKQAVLITEQASGDLHEWLDRL